MVPVVGAPAHEDGRRVGGAVGARQLHDVGSRDLGDLLGPLGRPRLQFTPHVDEAGHRLDGRAVGERHLERALERDLDVVGEAEAVGARDDRAAAGLVPGHERGVGGGRVDVDAAQPPAGVGPHEQRSVRVGTHELGVPEVVRDDLATERKAERGIGPRQDAQVGIGLRRGMRERGVDDDEPGALLHRVEDEVDVRDAGLDGVAADEQQEAAVGPVLGLVLGVLDAEGDGHAHGQVAVEVEARPVGHAQQRRGAVVGALLDVARARHLAEDMDGVPAPACPDVLQPIGHPVEGLLPRGLAKGARAALAVADERRQDAVRTVDLVDVAQALHAAARRVDRVGVVGRLLDLHDHAVAHEGQLAAAAGAVGRAGGTDHAVDGQARIDVVVASGADRRRDARQAAGRDRACRRS